jgi:hypothetical protein
VEVLEASLKDCDQELGLVSFVSCVIFMDKQFPYNNNNNQAF